MSLCGARVRKARVEGNAASPPVTEPGVCEAVYCGLRVGVVAVPTVACALTRASRRVGARVVVRVFVWWCA